MCVALGHPPPAGQHDVVLVAVMGVDAGGVTGLDDHLEDAHVARRPGVDLLDPDAPLGPVVGRSRGRTTRGGADESSRSHAAGTSSAPAIVASASSDGTAFSFSICDEVADVEPAPLPTWASVRPRDCRQRRTSRPTGSRGGVPARLFFDSQPT